MKSFKIIAFTHKSLDLNHIGKLHIDDANVENRLNQLKHNASLDELMYLSTCNRVEFLIVNRQKISDSFFETFFNAFNPEWDKEQIAWAKENAQIFEGEGAVHHLFSVASSLDSLIMGEREIITQVRNSYETCYKLHLTGDLIRLIIKQTIETAKDIYSSTNIASKPVSVVSLANRMLKELNVKPDASFLIIGAGVTNTNLVQYLKKNKFNNFVVFNRTLANAEKLANELHGEAFALSELNSYKKGFDVLVTCTASAEHIVSESLYSKLLAGDTTKKTIIDLALPTDIDPQIKARHNVNVIEMTTLQNISKENLAGRAKETDACNIIIEKHLEEFRHILKHRKVELAMSEVPKKVKEIRALAMSEVFAKEIDTLDEQSKLVLEKVMEYMEKKYISVPMKMAKDILIEEIN